MNYTVSLRLNFSSAATGWSYEKIQKTPGSAGQFGGSARPVVAFISNDPQTCPANEKTLAPSKDEVIADCDRLKPTELRKRYPGEATSHRNMLDRRRNKGAIIHPDFRKFASFLRHVRAKPTKESTLDRIDNTDPEYAPGKVRWADKRTQNSNKGDSLTFHDPRSGEVYTTSRLAALHRVKPGTIRKWRQRGWSNDEIIKGYKLGTEDCSQPEKRRPTRRRNYAEPVNDETQRNRLPEQAHRPKMAREIMFEQNRESILWQREQNNGIDYLPATPDEVLEIFSCERDFSFIVRLYPRDLTVDEVKARFRDDASRKFKTKIWPEYRPHVEWERIAPEQRDYIEQIDSEWVKQQKARASVEAAMSDLL